MGSTDAIQPVSDVSQILQQNPMVDVKPNMLYFKIPVVIKKQISKRCKFGLKTRIIVIEMYCELFYSLLRGIPA